MRGIDEKGFGNLFFPLQERKREFHIEVLMYDLLAVENFFREFHILLRLSFKVCNPHGLELVFPHQQDIRGVYDFD